MRLRFGGVGSSGDGRLLAEREREHDGERARTDCRPHAITERSTKGMRYMRYSNHTCERATVWEKPTPAVRPLFSVASCERTHTSSARARTLSPSPSDVATRRWLARARASCCGGSRSVARAHAHVR